ALEEPAPVRIELAAVIPCHIPDEADARRPVVFQIERGLLVAVANVLPFPADSGVYRQSGASFPRVLRVERGVVRVRLRCERHGDLPRRWDASSVPRSPVVDVVAMTVVDN